MRICATNPVPFWASVVALNWALSFSTSSQCLCNLTYSSLKRFNLCWSSLTSSETKPFEYETNCSVFLTIEYQLLKDYLGNYSWRLLHLNYNVKYLTKLLFWIIYREKIPQKPCPNVGGFWKNLNHNKRDLNISQSNFSNWGSVLIFVMR